MNFPDHGGEIFQKGEKCLQKWSNHFENDHGQKEKKNWTEVLFFILKCPNSIVKPLLEEIKMLKTANL